jgi:hypothetical protein
MLPSIWGQAELMRELVPARRRALGEDYPHTTRQQVALVAGKISGEERTDRCEDIHAASS